MERMTTRSILGGWTLKVPRQEAVDRLAAYEDTGLEPEEIKDILERYLGFRSAISDETGQPMVSWTRASKLVRADKEGRVVVLPVKTVFEPVWDAGGTCDLRCPERFDGLDTCQGCPKAVPYAHQREYRTEDIIGKTVFLTPAEAEAAMGGGGDG